MKKIHFNDKFSLTEAVLSGRKTQTRRIITPQPTFETNCGICWKGGAYGLGLDYPYGMRETYRNFVSGTEYDKSCKRYRVGEEVAVAQCYNTISESISTEQSVAKAEFFCKVMRTHYPQTEIAKDKEEIAGWYNKMFISASLMPHRIRITNVRVERLNEISAEDCIKEGVYVGTSGATYHVMNLGICANTPQQAYAALIDRISGKGLWESNPWVFAYDFELVK